MAPFRSASRGVGQNSGIPRFSQNAVRSLTTGKASSIQHANEHQERASKASQNGGIRIGEENTSSSKGFFSSRWRDLSSTLGEGEGGPSSTSERNLQKDDSTLLPFHPLVQDLMYELQSHEARPSPELVWRLYSAIEMTKQSSVQLRDDQSSSSQTSLILPIHVHKRVLRTIKPSFAGKSKRKAVVASSAEVQQYLARVSIIFDNLRRQSAGTIPTAADFDKVFHEIVQSGNMTCILALWSAMTGSASLERTDSKRAKQRNNARVINAQMNAFNAIEPTRDTYSNLMLGVYRHLQDQLKRALKSDLQGTKELNYGQQRRQRLAATREGELSQSMKKAIESRSAFEHLSPRAQQALVLASQRTSYLLRSMLERDIPLTKLACNLAMRVMRITGNLDAMKALTTLSFGVDLDNLDGSVLDSSKSKHNLPTHFYGKADVHLLNTVIQALGEQSTVGKMVAAYETLTRPLPKSIKVDTQVPEGSLFATDFRGLLGWNDPVEADSTANDVKEVSQDVSSLYITPNTATMIHLVRNACRHPPPQQMMMYISRSMKEQLGQMKEYEARQKGAYSNLALYFVRETVSVQEESLKKMAKGLGFDKDYVSEMISYITTQVQSLGVESFSGLPHLQDENFTADYLARLFFLSEDTPQKAESILSNLAKAIPIEETEIMSEEQKIAVQAANQAADEAYATRQEFARQFLINLVNLPSPSFSGEGGQSFNPTSIGVAPEVVMPLITLTKQNRMNGILRDVGEWMERSIALYICEIRLLNAAIASEDSALERSFDQMRERVDELNRVIQSDARLLVWQVRRQIVQLSEKRRERTKKRKEVKQQAKFAALAQSQEQEREKAARKLRLAEEKAAAALASSTDAEGVTVENVNQSRQNIVSA